MDDRELEALLAVEPSPEFLARVRASIAEAPIAPRIPRFLPTLGAVTAVAALVTVALIPVSRSGAPVRRPSAIPAVSPAAAQVEVPEVTSAAEPTRPRPVSRPAVAPLTPRASDFPEVLVSPDVLRNFNEVVASAAARRFEISPEGMQALLDNTIPEMAIAPANSPVNDQGAPQ